MKEQAEGQGAEWGSRGCLLQTWLQRASGHALASPTCPMALQQPCSTTWHPTDPGIIPPFAPKHLLYPHGILPASPRFPFLCRK